MKAAREFGILGGPQQATAFFLTPMDVKGVGLEAAQGTIPTEAFHWSTDERTCAFSERFRVLHGAMPAPSQAGDYSVALHCLRAAAAPTTEAKAVVAKMHALPVQDDVVRHATLRPDGRLMHDTCVAQVKRPAEARWQWDLRTLIGTTPAAEAFRPLSESTCPLIPKQPVKLHTNEPALADSCRSPVLPSQWCRCCG